MKGLVQYINEYKNDILQDIKDDVVKNWGKEEWKNCDRIDFHDMITDITRILNKYHEHTTIRTDEKLIINKNLVYHIEELLPLNDMKDFARDIIVVSWKKEKHRKISETILHFIEDTETLLKNKYEKCIFEGNRVNIFFEKFDDLMICAVSERPDINERDWTFYIASDKI